MAKPCQQSCPPPAWGACVGQGRPGGVRGTVALPMPEVGRGGIYSSPTRQNKREGRQREKRPVRLVKEGWGETQETSPQSKTQGRALLGGGTCEQKQGRKPRILKTLLLQTPSLAEGEAGVPRRDQAGSPGQREGGFQPKSRVHAEKRWDQAMSKGCKLPQPASRGTRPAPHLPGKPRHGPASLGLQLHPPAQPSPAPRPCPALGPEEQPRPGWVEPARGPREAGLARTWQGPPQRPDPPGEVGEAAGPAPSPAPAPPRAGCAGQQARGPKSGARGLF